MVNTPSYWCFVADKQQIAYVSVSAQDQCVAYSHFPQDKKTTMIGTRVADAGACYPDVQ